MTEIQEGSPDLPSIGDEILRFVSHLDSLNESIPLVGMVIIAAHGVSTKRLHAFEKRYCEVEESDSTRRVAVPVEHWVDFQHLLNQHSKMRASRDLVLRSFVVSFVSEYDAFVGRLIRAFFLLRPDILDASDRTFTFSQLLEFGFVESTKEFVIEKEVESLLRKSHSDQFDWLSNKFGIKLRTDLASWPDFIELTERRNLFVHNSGVVSNQYLSVCEKNGVSFEEDREVGAYLPVNSKYLRLVYNCIFEIGVKLGHVLWRKVLPDDRDNADTNFNSICYGLLSEGKYQLACTMLDFGVNTIRKYSSEQIRRTFVVNRSQAYKWYGNQDMSQKIIKGEDWSAASDVFKLAEAVILDDFGNAAVLMRKLANSDDISESDYRVWPLFQEFRKTSVFREAFEELFGYPLETVDLSKSVSGDSDDANTLSDDLSEADESYDPGSFLSSVFMDLKSFIDNVDSTDSGK